MTIIDLTGCATRPIGSYLKALGVFRLVSDQLDTAAHGSWVGDTFRLEAETTPEGLVEFLVDAYAPTPLVSPWNGGSGYSPKDKAALEAINAILKTSGARLDPYRRAIATARDLVADPAWETGGKDKKQHQIARCRSRLPDATVEWLDASVVLTNDRAVFPPLFGTGGNDGRLEFSSNFMQRLVELLIEPRPRTAPSSTDLAHLALFGGAGRLEKGTAGQFDPASVVPDVTAPTGRDGSLSNPWDFVLLIEGGLVFASAAARRLGTGTSIRAAMPFCVDATPVGSASSADEDSRGEIWMPLWRRPASFGEITRLIGEGRARWGGDQATTGVDFAKAVAALGVDRGLDRFVRHGITQRYGLSYLAVPLGEVRVGARPEVNVLGRVDRWLHRLPRQLPAAAATARRRVEAAEFRAAADPAARPPTLLQQVLLALADLEVAVSRSSDRAEIPWPVGGGPTSLPAGDWLPYLDDGTPELRLAVALASARDPFPSGPLDGHARTASSLALAVRPIRLRENGALEWAPGPTRVEGLSHRPVTDVLAEVLVDRSIRITQRAPADDAPETPGARLGFDLGIPAEPGDLLALAEGRIDLDRLRDLVRGLLLLDWRARQGSERPELRTHSRDASSGWSRRATPTMATLLPFFHAHPIPAVGSDGMSRELELTAQPQWPHLLAAGRVDTVLENAVHRLRIAGIDPAVRHPRPTTAETAGALAVAAQCRLRPATVRALVRQISPAETRPSDPSTATTEETS